MTTTQHAPHLYVIERRRVRGRLWRPWPDHKPFEHAAEAQALVDYLNVRSDVYRFRQVAYVRVDD